MKTLKIGTRKSTLALWQTDHVAAQLQLAWPTLTCEKVTFVTEGDKSQALGKPLPQIGGKGLFTQELEEALRQGRIDLAVHSLKDLPVEQPDDLVLGAILSRADVRDVLVAREGWTLATLPAGASVGTSSPRRQAQLLAARPDLQVRSIRGNVETRINKVLERGEYDAAVLAAAGVVRLGLDVLISQWLPLATMLPAPGQGALAVQCRRYDVETLQLLAAIENETVRHCVEAERAFLQTLGGGCAAPIGAYATMQDGLIWLEALAAAPDGSQQVKVNGACADPQVLGQSLALEALARGAGRLIGARGLAGKRVVVTRSVSQAGALADRLEAAGAQPLVFPVIRFEPLPPEPLQAALGQIEKYEWLIFTSVNAVEFFLAAYGGQPLPRVAAVGEATTTRLQNRGIPVAYVPATFTGEALAHGLGALTGRSVLLPRACNGRPDIVAALQAAGAVVDDIPLYETVPAEPTVEALAELARGVDMITFTSPSSVRNFVSLVSGTAVEGAVAGATVACIGPSTAAEAEALGLTVAIVPEQYTIDDLIAAIEEHYA
ncbi:MAG: hydroxymethylbilane synthase [Ardenticatenales bacterium]|nr:hydroxymethylbilane synthase [Ardenticatenales bacterium]